MKDVPELQPRTNRELFPRAVLQGIPRLEIRVLGRNFRFPDPRQVIQEGDVVAANLPEGEKERCLKQYRDLYLLITAAQRDAQEILAKEKDRPDSPALNVDDGALVAAFRDSANLAKQIERQYGQLRQIEVRDYVDKTVKGITPEPPHKLDTKI